MKLLITGFDPFGDDDYNPSYEAIKNLPKIINNIEITTLELPTEFLRARDVLMKRLEHEHFDTIILCGQAAGRKTISLERVAVNLMDARISDNSGYMPKDIPVIEGGDTAYFTNIDIRKIENALKDKEIPVNISYSAGAYVCNSTYYNLLHKIYTEDLKSEGLFVHIPIIPKQKKNYKEDYFTMELEEITKAIQTIIEGLN